MGSPRRRRGLPPPRHIFAAPHRGRPSTQAPPQPLPQKGTDVGGARAHVRRPHTRVDSSSPAISVESHESQWATLGWYRVISVDLSADTLTPSEWAVLTGRLGLQVDTINTEMQICRYASFSPGQYSFQLRTLADFTVPGAAQYTYQIPLVDGTTGTSGTIYELGWFIRNATLGTLCTVTSASLTVKQNK